MSEKSKRVFYGSIYMIIMWFGTAYSELTFNLLFGIILLVCLYEMWILRKGKTKILAFCYVIIPLILIQIFSMNNHNHPNNTFNSNIILFMFILTWTFDTFAYLIGIKFGKNKIMPSISPKKSWEGFIGGFIFTIIACYLSYNYFEINPFTNALIISILLPFTATAGDFIASYYKRKAKKKDSGNLIPGHGGILDRIDGMIFAFPISYIIFQI